MKFIVCGGRDYADRARVKSVLDAVHGKCRIHLLIEGGATGADRLSRDWALANGIQVATFHANWDHYKGYAGPLRNQAMADQRPDGLIAFPGGKGTAGMIKICEEMEIKVMQIA
jgi:predicted Rossmann-fold nucleotide-binding protein